MEGEGHRLVFFYSAQLVAFFSPEVQEALKSEQSFKFMCCGSGDF